eukprot:4555768-Pleurochrysis_carterae.AAC.1
MCPALEPAGWPCAGLASGRQGSPQSSASQRGSASGTGALADARSPPGRRGRQVLACVCAREREKGGERE